MEILELIDFDAKTNTPVVNQIYKWNPQNDAFEVANKSVLLRRISEMTGISEDDIKREIETRMAILTWMKKNNIVDYKRVHEVFSMYYNNPQKLLALIRGGAR